MALSGKPVRVHREPAQVGERPAGENGQSRRSDRSTEGAELVDAGRRPASAVRLPGRE
jgi:hypothetical protein